LSLTTDDRHFLLPHKGKHVKGNKKFVVKKFEKKRKEKKQRKGEKNNQH
jgi:hypothetical protein